MKLALTFDDGPSAWTPTVLDLLRDHEARATFFVIGARVRERPDDVRRIAAEGHELGSHTLTHPRLTEIPDDEVRSEILGGAEALAEVLGEASPLFRAPGFHAAERELAIVAELGLEAVFADVDPEDWRAEKDSHTIFRHVLDGVRGALLDGRPIGDGGGRSMFLKGSAASRCRQELENTRVLTRSTAVRAQNANAVPARSPVTSRSRFVLSRIVAS